jgi:hypothetical protein
MDGAPEVEVNGVVFKYAEIRLRHRAIKIWTAGVKPVEYRIDPDPHGDSAYEKKPARFYLEIATAIGNLYVPGLLPPFGSTVHSDLTDLDYTLNER